MVLPMRSMPHGSSSVLHPTKLRNRLTHDLISSTGSVYVSYHAGVRLAGDLLIHYAGLLGDFF